MTYPIWQIALAAALLLGCELAQAQGMAPISSTFDTSEAIERLPISRDSGADVGAMRFICMPVTVGKFDPIVFPGQNEVGHEHVFFGNVNIGPYTTYASLRAGGRDDASCQGIGLNLSSYWTPTLRDGEGRALVPDWFSAYYKGDCAGPTCVPPKTNYIKPIPTGLRAIAGVNMAETDPVRIKINSNAKSWRCLRGNDYIPGPNGDAKQPDLQTLIDAGCGSRDGDAAIAAVHFGKCWNGEIDSRDHRSHLVHPVWDNGRSGAPYPGRCPATHPHIIPEMTQQVQWTLRANDKGLHLSSDRMPDGTIMRAGSSFHADYMEAWDRPTLETWHQWCIVGHRHGVAGEFCNGTAGKYPAGFAFSATQRGPRHFPALSGAAAPPDRFPSPAAKLVTPPHSSDTAAIVAERYRTENDVFWRIRQGAEVGMSGLSLLEAQWACARIRGCIVQE